jgi:hypothetical protein
LLHPSQRGRANPPGWRLDGLAVVPSPFMLRGARREHSSGGIL